MQKPRKPYKTPKLATHGGVEKLTQSSHAKSRRKAPPSGLPGRGGKGHGDD